MAFNSLGQYVGTHKSWDHVGNIFPNVEHSEGERPAIEWKPAAWLPVVFFEKYYENWMVIMAGKVVACDPDGRLCPAGMKIPAELAGTGDVVTYTVNDVTSGTTNVATGRPVTMAELTDNSGTTRGYTKAEIDAAGFLGQSGRAFTVSAPVGVAPYAYLQWAGGDGSNPSEFKQHNYQMQHQVAALCDYVLTLPLVPALASSAPLTFTASASLTDENVFTASGVSASMAANSLRTPITFTGGSSSTLFVTEVDTAADISGPGQFAIEPLSGNVSVYSVSAPTGVVMSYYSYAAVNAATVSVFAAATGDLHPGDLVTFDADSNFTKLTPTTGYLSATPTAAQVIRLEGLVIGQVLDREAGPKAGLDKVKTSFSPALGTSATGGRPAYLGQLDQMPGSATGGAPAAVSYAGAADTVVRVNLTRW